LSEPLAIPFGDGRTLPGLHDRPAGARALCVLAHGAGAGMRHPFLAQVAGALAERAIACLRYEFPYMAARKPRPDPPAIAEAAVRAAVAQARALAPELPLVAGGKSFGGRMTSQAAARASLPGVRGLVFLGFPLHPPGAPSAERARHLAEVTLPMLFLTGTRDEFAPLDLLRPVVAGLGPRARLCEIADGDHSFAVRKRAGRQPSQVMAELADAIAEFVLAVAG
jgi:predicted alpha/beta-hydrolase family hydrolase